MSARFPEPLPPEPVAVLPAEHRRRYLAGRAAYDAELAAAMEELRTTGRLTIAPRSVYVARCGRPVGRGPCLAPRGHEGPHSPTWRAQ